VEFSSEVYDIINRVKSLSGKDVEIIENPSLTTYAKVKAARSTMDKSIIQYKKTENFNYLIAHECAHLIRIFQCDPEFRLIPAITSEGMSRAIEELKTRMAYLNINYNDFHYQFLINQYIIQIISQAQDIWVEKYIYENYPGLHLEQKLNALNMWKDAIKLTPKEIKNIVPKYLYNGTYALNIAFKEAFYTITGTSMAEPTWMKPFHSTASKLFNAIDFESASLIEDNELIIRKAGGAELERISLLK
jgi:hypothetical protein